MPEDESEDEIAHEKYPVPKNPVACSWLTSTGESIKVFAAGAVLWRKSPEGAMEVALVHRPHYDDWSLPKGKLDPGETAAYAAAREILEETGFSCELSRFLASVSYPVPTPDGGHTGKVVDYFAARVRGGEFVPNGEVDRLRWIRVEQARQELTYASDARLLDTFKRLPTDVATLLLVRHAEAGERSEWTGDDNLRPLSEAGIRQRDTLRTLLPLFGPKRAYSAPRLRCEQTIAPVAEDAGIGIGSEPRLSEEGYWRDPQAGVQRLLRIAAEPGVALMCSQGAVIPDLVNRLANAAGMDLGEVQSRKGSLWTLTFRREPNTGPDSREDGAGPVLRLAAADYLDDPVLSGISPVTADL